MSKIKYISYKQIIEIHDYAINKTKGLEGYKDLGLIKSALELIQDDLYYPRFIDKLTHLVYSIIKNHSFNDANKRTSISSANIFINENRNIILKENKDFNIDLFVETMEKIVVFVADNVFDNEDLKKILSILLYGSQNQSIVILKLLTPLDKNYLKMQDENGQVPLTTKLYIKNVIMKYIDNPTLWTVIKMIFYRPKSQ